MATKSSTAVKPQLEKKRTVDFSGVKGEFVVDDAPAGVLFGTKKRMSPYDALLMRLRDAGRGHLVFDDVKARVSVAVRAKKLGIGVEFGEPDEGALSGKLLVRLTVSGTPEKVAERRDAMVRVLKNHHGMTDQQATNALRNETGEQRLNLQDVQLILAKLQRDGVVVCVAGAWKLARS